MAASLGVAVVMYVFITQDCTARTISQQLDVLPVLKSTHVDPGTSSISPRYMEVEEEVSRMFLRNFKTLLIRMVKFYRSMKPEVKLATCFTRYAGITSSERSYQCGRGECEGRAMKEEEVEEEEVTVQKFLRQVVHAMMLFMADLTPQPVSIMMKTVMEMWYTTRNMYKAVKQDEMGNCSIDYMSKRFWWWLGI